MLETKPSVMAIKLPAIGNRGSHGRAGSECRGPSLVLIVAVIAVYWNSLCASLPFDSVALVRDDTRVQTWTWHNIGLILGQNYWGVRFQSGLYRPVITLSWLAQHGQPNWAFHLVNLLLHLGVTLLAYALLLQIVPKIAFWATLLWAVHPINTEAVTNVAGRPDLVAAACVLGELLLYGMAASRGRRRWRLLGICAVSLIGCLSKESAIVLLPLILLYDWWGNWGRVPYDRPAFLAACIPVGLVILIRCALSISCGVAKPFVDNPMFGMGFFQGRLLALKAAGKLLGLWLWPATLSADYSYGQIACAGLPWLLFGLALICPVFWAFRARGVMAGWAPFWALFALVAWLPTSNLLVPVGSIMAERFLYLPGLGLSVLLVMAIGGLYNRIKGDPEAPLHFNSFPAALLAILICVLGIRTIYRNRDYRDDLTFWRATVAASPQSFKPHTQLSIELWKRGDQAGALEQARLATAILDTLPASQVTYEPYVQAWGYYQAVGDSGEARRIADRIAAIFNAAPKCKRCASF